MWNAYEILTGIAERKRALMKPKLMCKDNIKMDPKLMW
jgi:hypothetical protein